VKPTGFEIEPKPFESDVFQMPSHDSQDKPNKTNKPKKILPTIRWQWGLDERDNPTRQSNARLVRWSDGTFTMFIGTEPFTVNATDLPTTRHQIFLRQRKDADSESFLTCHGVLEKRLNIQPKSIDHLKVQAQEHLKKIMEGKKRGRNIYTGGVGDPEKDKIAKEALEESKNQLKQKYAFARDPEMSREFLEREADQKAEAKILASKKNFVDEEEEGDDELQEEMEDIDEEEEELERKTKKQRR